ncbi:hypothetical protein C0431_02620 [bacterium]|nr:hypothetical protein [bacterium]
MKLVLPFTHSSFGDSTNHRDSEHQIKNYVLAQIPGNFQLDWVDELRSFLTIQELKWPVYLANKHKIQANRNLSKKIKDTLKATTVVIIRPGKIIEYESNLLIGAGAKPDIDFNIKEIHSRTAVTLIRGTPLAFLPNKLSEELQYYTPGLANNFEDYLPHNLWDRAGGKLNDAVVLAARSHAIFDLDVAEARSAIDGLSKPLELSDIQRVFDEEHPFSVDVLNQALSFISDTLLSKDANSKPIVKEASSIQIDALQAADIAAGWASLYSMDDNDRALCDTFGKVIINGQVIAC